MTPNAAASVHQRLLNYARSNNRPFNEVLQYFALERFLYRLGASPYREQFVLKGALMFTAWQTPFSRPTRDIDLLGRMSNSVEHVVSVIRDICQQNALEDNALEDGMLFDADGVSGERTVEAAQYEGVRVRFRAYLGKARVPMQIDVGFGDPLVPGASPVRLPTILDFAAPSLQGYSRESAIAEKLQAMVYLGDINSRMKDFYDIRMLATHFAFDGAVVARAIGETFSSRDTVVPRSPVAFSDAFSCSPEKQTQWAAFVRRLRLEDAPATLHEVTQAITVFLGPVLRAISAGQEFDRYWPPAGPWLEVPGTSESAGHLRGST